MADIPNSQKPKVAASAVAGAIATMLIWLWNTRFPESAMWHAGDLVVGAFVTIVTWFTGPLIRRYQQWAETPRVDQDVLQAIVEIDKRLKKIEGKEA